MVDTVEMVKMRHHAKFAVISWYFDFQDGGRRRLEFSKF